MPLNPFTGEFEGYDSPSTQAGMGMAAMSASNVDAPLAFRMLEDAPGITASIGFSSMRGSNTIMRGGYSRKNYLNKSASNFTGTKARRMRAARADKIPFVRRALQNNLPRPGNLTRYSDLSIFASPKRRLYTPFAASSLFDKSSKLSGALGVKAGEGTFGPGLLSFISAGTRVDRLERRALAGSARARGKLSTIDTNIKSLAGMNNPSIVNTPSAVQQARINPRYSGNSPLTAQQRLAAARANVAKGPFYNQAMSKAVAPAGVAGIGKYGVDVGVRGNLLASSMAGIGTQKLAGYFRGAMGYGRGIGYTGLEGAAKSGARMAEKQFVAAFGKAGLGSRSAAYSAMQVGNLSKSVGIKGMSKIATSGGAKVLAARGIGLAIPGLQVLAAASFAYDIGKMAGEVVKSTVNLARDSVKSLQGSIHKPLFGMGYQDTEAAATSRARGVMAIQNSRLNARSVLGSEAGMMAAHFG